MATARHRRKLPAWQLGLIVAVVLFVGAIVIFNLLGFGDDPVIEGLAANLG
ncbi:MAG TPA: hypothetical protein VI141_08020 [Acidimicrobiia bacterium]